MARPARPTSSASLSASSWASRIAAVSGSESARSRARSPPTPERAASRAARSAAGAPAGSAPGVACDPPTRARRSDRPPRRRRDAVEGVARSRSLGRGRGGRRGRVVRRADQLRDRRRGGGGVRPARLDPHPVALERAERAERRHAPGGGGPRAGGEVAHADLGRRGAGGPHDGRGRAGVQAVLAGDHHVEPLPGARVVVHGLPRRRRRARRGGRPCPPGRCGPRPPPRPASPPPAPPPRPPPRPRRSGPRTAARPPAPRRRAGRARSRRSAPPTRGPSARASPRCPPARSPPSPSRRRCRARPARRCRRPPRSGPRPRPCPARARRPPRPGPRCGRRRRCRPSGPGGHQRP